MTKTKDKKTGIYKVTFRTEHGRRTMSTGCTNEKDADLFIKKSKVQELETTARAVRLTPQIVNQIVVGKRVTMEKAVADWLEWMTVIGRSPRTIENNRVTVAAWMRDKKLDALSPSEINERHIHSWINATSDIKKGTRTVALAAIRSFFECCAAKCYCIGNPSLAVKVQMSGMTHQQKETRVKTVFTPAEYKRLSGLLNREKQYLENHIKEIQEAKWHRNATRAIKTFERQLDIATFWYLAVPIGRWTGLRLGDICQLEWDCFAQMDRANVWTDKRDRRVSLPLTPKEFLKDLAAKKIELPAKVKAAALAWYEQLEANFLPLIGAIPIKDKTYCFPEERQTINDPRLRSRFSSQFGRICERAQMPQHSFHDFRHTYVTDMNNLGLPIEHISQSVGHISTGTTANYIH